MARTRRSISDAGSEAKAKAMASCNAIAKPNQNHTSHQLSLFRASCCMTEKQQPPVANNAPKSVCGKFNGRQ
jgi:hypothetical protein